MLSVIFERLDLFLDEKHLSHDAPVTLRAMDRRAAVADHDALAGTMPIHVRGMRSVRLPEKICTHLF